MPRAFYAQRIWLPLLWAGVLTGGYLCFFAFSVARTFWSELPVETMLLGLVALLWLLGSLWGLWRLRRPILSISEEKIEQTWILTPRRQELSALEFSGAAHDGSDCVVLGTTTGEPFAIRLDLLRKRERPEARAAIRSWVTGHSASRAE